MKRIKVFAPATVANVACGFDILGFALSGIGDELEAEITNTGIFEIAEIKGCDGLPTAPEKNVATVAASALLADYGKNPGFIFKMNKTVLPGSGLGSSASSSAAAVFAVNELLGKPYSKEKLVEFAAQGEKAASLKAHYDNVSPSILGGFTLVRSNDPLDIIKLSYPEELVAVIAHPQVEVKTSDAKKILKQDVKLKDAITQWGNVAGLTAGLLTSDFDLIGRSMVDVIVEPVRSMLIPHYDAVKEASLSAGALGCSISGSGPSIFSLCQGEEDANKVLDAVKKVYANSGLNVLYYVSKINNQGAHIIE